MGMGGVRLGLGVPDAVPDALGVPVLEGVGERDGVEVAVLGALRTFRDPTQDRARISLGSDAPGSDEPTLAGGPNKRPPHRPACGSRAASASCRATGVAPR